MPLNFEFLQDGVLFSSSLTKCSAWHREGSQSNSLTEISYSVALDIFHYKTSYIRKFHKSSPDRNYISMFMFIENIRDRNSEVFK